MAGKKAFLPDQALDAAMNLFWKQGYEASSIEDIVQATGLGRGSLYDTFGDKHALYVAALKRYLTKVPSDIEQDEQIALKETLERYFYHWIDLLLADPERRGCFLVNATMEMAPCDAEVAAITQSALQVLEEKFYHLLIKAQVQGALPWTYDPHQGAHFLLGILVSIRVLARAKQERTVLQDVVKTALSVFP
jgi:TetR/AcrR family transcriptional regulator, transcriptional repressor for nem operon